MRAVSGRFLDVVGFLARWLALVCLEALLLLLLSAILSGVPALSFAEAVLVALALALINGVLWPVLTRLALPFTILSFGLASLALSAGGVALAFYVVSGDAPPFGQDLVIALCLALVSTIAVSLLDV